MKKKNIKNKKNKIKTIFAIGSLLFILYLIAATLDAYSKGNFA